MNENELARIRRAQRPDCYQRSGKGIPAFVGQVTTTQSLIGIGKVLVVARCQPLAPADTEGSTPTFGMDGANEFATLIGPGTPNTGDYVLVERTDYRWVTEHPNATTHGGRVVILGCPCPTSPITLTMTSSAPASNNHILQSATLTYGPTPAALAALGIGQSAYLSTATFTDFSTGDQFWYYLSCYLGYYILTRVYATSLYGSPYHDMIRYRWPISDPTNSCNPFALNTGQIFSGGDPSCVVTVTG